MWRDVVDTGLAPRARRQAYAERAVRYDLATALLVVRTMETSAGRGAVFDEIKRKNRLYLLVDTLYAKAGARFFQPLLLFAYMLKCALSVGPFRDQAAQAVAISNFPNEKHTVDRVAALVPDAAILRLSIERKHLFAWGQAVAAWRMLGCLGRMWPFLQALARAHSFMPSARIASAIAFYVRYLQLFQDRPELKAAIVASNYSPEAVGMAAAAHRKGRRVIYANHAPVPANGAVVPPVLADCALFYGEVNRRTYERRSRCVADVAFIGLPTAARQMEWRDSPGTIGIFLTSGTRIEVVARLVADIRSTWPNARVLIRNHPVALLKTDLSALGDCGGNVEVTLGNPLDEEIAACDMIICGNSGVALNALSGGRPVAYIAELDHVRFDSNGFVGSGLVCRVEGWDEGVYDRLRSFYKAPGWADVMRTYDAAYGADAAALRAAAAATVRRYL